MGLPIIIPPPLTDTNPAGHASLIPPLNPILVMTDNSQEHGFWVCAEVPKRRIQYFYLVPPSLWVPFTPIGNRDAFVSAEIPRRRVAYRHLLPATQWVPFIDPPIVMSSWWTASVMASAPLRALLRDPSRHPALIAALNQATSFVVVVPPIVPGTQSLCDNDLLRVVAQRTLEPVLALPGPSTTMWTRQDWIQALDQAQKDFIQESGLIVAHLGYKGDTDTSLNTTPQIQYLPMPQDMIEILRVAWESYDASNNLKGISELPRDDAWSLDAMDSKWEVDLGSPDPTAYNESLPRIPAIYFVHPPADIGRADLLYIALPTTLNGTCVPMTVPDEFCPYIVYGALKTLLNMPGEANDPQRAAYCQSRWEEGLALAKMLLMKPFTERIQ